MTIAHMHTQGRAGGKLRITEAIDSRQVDDTAIRRSVRILNILPSSSLDLTTPRASSGLAVGGGGYGSAHASPWGEGGC